MVEKRPMLYHGCNVVKYYGFLKILQYWAISSHLSGRPLGVAVTISCGHSNALQSVKRRFNVRFLSAQPIQLSAGIIPPI